MSARVLLWSDYVSPYAFVAKAGAYALEADYEIALEWRPYTLDIPSFQGSVKERDPHHWRRVRYAYMDARRFANKQGLTLKGPKKVFYARQPMPACSMPKGTAFSANTTISLSTASGGVSSIRNMSMPWQRC